MKKALLIIGIIVLVLGVISLLLALFFRWAFTGVLDGSQNLYQTLKFRMYAFLIAGIILSVIGTVCLIVRRFVG